jgi:type I restriction enzyme M protein
MERVQSSGIANEFEEEATTFLRFVIGGLDLKEGLILILFLKREGLLNGFNPPESRLLLSLDSWIRQNAKDTIIYDVYRKLQHSVIYLEAPEYSNLMDRISILPDDLFKEYYPSIIDRLIEWTNKSQSQKDRFFDLPHDLAHLIVQLAQVPQGSLVYNPYAGTAPISAYLPDGVQYVGQEESGTAWALGVIRLRSQRCTALGRLENEDAYKKWLFEDQYVDRIIAFPPWVGLVQSETLGSPQLDLIPDGRAVVMTSRKYLYGGNLENDWKEDFIGYLDAVILFPPGLLPHTSSPFALLVLDRARDTNAPVRMVDATPFTLGVGSPRLRVDSESLLSVLSTSKEHSSIRWVTQEAIRAQDYNLSPSWHLLPEEVRSGEPLGSVVRSIRSTRKESTQVGLLLRAQDLKEDALDYTLDLRDVSSAKITTSARFLDRSALLLSVRRGNPKPTWFEYDGTPVFIGQDILAVEADMSKVHLPYLVHQLLSAGVLKQMAAMDRGQLVPLVRKEDLLQLRVKIPTVEEQRVIAQGLSEGLMEARLDKARKAAEANGLELRQFEEADQLAHVVRKPLNEISSGFRTLMRTLNELQPGWRDQRVGGAKRSMGEVTDALLDELEKISSILNTGVSILDPIKFPLAAVDLVKYVRDKARWLTSDSSDSLKLDVGVVIDVPASIKGKLLLRGNIDLLNIAVDAIIENAKRHAFSGVPAPHLFEFRLEVVNDEGAAYVVLSMRNSGRPFPEGFGLQEYTMKNYFAGDTGNTGIGGYHVHKVMTRHNGKVDLRTGPGLFGLYSTSIDLYFPLNLA